MQDIDKKRRGLFSSLSNFLNDEPKKVEKLMVRPPYFEGENSFDQRCKECEGLCATFCEENIILIDEDSKTPYLSFDKNGCTYCDECAKNCPKDVLKLEYKKRIEIDVEIDVLSCLSWNDTMCFSCKDPCLEDAIKFLGIFRPSIDEKLCTSCGFCIAVCPSNAIKIKEKIDA